MMVSILITVKLMKFVTMRSVCFYQTQKNKNSLALINITNKAESLATIAPSIASATSFN
ncbi:hypothetical protein CPS_2447 [Colwellia psychrerythraea 34H]|uniref:Uncharacterized protein n=1 Tax=Colwellia psychrerythraea (strain 34H / ATCC BAA-681) TaxID=167879 RepID=Q481V5_COLP3|nr:hypothetical protein CPS_2447 [Colwellia psychrerythraea 34H]